MIVFTAVGIAVAIIYCLVALLMIAYAYVDFYNPNRISPRPTRKRRHGIYYWPLRPLVSIVEGLIWPVGAVRVFIEELR